MRDLVDAGGSTHAHWSAVRPPRRSASPDPEAGGRNADRFDGARYEFDRARRDPRDRRLGRDRPRTRPDDAHAGRFRRRPARRHHRLPVLEHVVGAPVRDRRRAHHNTGGVLSHAAVVAREFALPAVVGTGDATTADRRWAPRRTRRKHRDRAPPVTDPRRARLISPAMLGVASGAMLVPLNSTMLAVALPSIMDQFGVDAVTVSSLVTLYLGAVTIALLASGSLGDRYGQRPVFLVGVVAFARLVAARGRGAVVRGPGGRAVLQALSGALISTTSLALVRAMRRPIAEARRSGCSTCSSRRARRSVRSSAACSSSRSAGGRCSSSRCRSPSSRRWSSSCSSDPTTRPARRGADA